MQYNEKEVVQYGKNTGSSPAQKEGILFKKSKFGLDKQFFVLKGNLLFYFANSPNDPSPVGFLLVEAATVTSLGAPLEAGGDTYFTFLLSFDSSTVVATGEAAQRQLVLAALSEPERTQWMETIKGASHAALLRLYQAQRAQIQSQLAQAQSQEALVQTLQNQVQALQAHLAAGTAASPAAPATTSSSTLPVLASKASLPVMASKSSLPIVATTAPLPIIATTAPPVSVATAAAVDTAAAAPTRRPFYSNPQLSSSQSTLAELDISPSQTTLTDLEPFPGTSGSQTTLADLGSDGTEGGRPRANSNSTLYEGFPTGRPRSNTGNSTLVNPAVTSRERNMTGTVTTLYTMDPQTAPSGIPENLSHEMFTRSTKISLSMTCTHLHVENEGAKGVEFQLIISRQRGGGPWEHCHQTEVAKSNEVNHGLGVNFLVTMELETDDSTDASTKYKFALYSVDDFENGKTTPWGSAIFHGSQLRTPRAAAQSLKSEDGKLLANFQITLVASAPNESFSTLLPRTCPVTHLDFERMTQTYLIKLAQNKLLNIREAITESPFTFVVPYKFFRLLEREEKEMLKFFAPLDISAFPNLEKIKKEHVSFHHQMLSFHQATSVSIQNYQGKSFRASVYKKEDYMQPFAVNLHTHLMIVNSVDPSDSSVESQNSVYGIVTFGAAAYHQGGFKKGGAKSLIESHLKATSDKPTRKASLNKRPVSSAPVPGAVTIQENLVRSMAEATDPSFVTETSITYRPPVGEYTDLLALRRQYEDSSNELRRLFDQVGLPSGGKGPAALAQDKFDQLTVAMSHLSSKFLTLYDKVIASVQKNSPEEKHKTLDGLMTMINKSRLPALFNAVEQLTKAMNSVVPGRILIDAGVVQSLLLSEVSLTKDVLYLASTTLESLLDRILGGQFSLCDAALRTRLDIIMSQALSALVTVFALSLNTIVHPEVSIDTRNFFCEQLETLGYLAQFESLLSTKGDEIGMLEDFVVAVDGLRRVKFRLEDSAAPETSPESRASGVSIEGGRDALLVTLYLTPQRFQLLTPSLRNGTLITVVPIMFSQGINEQQTISNTLGQSAFQDQVNEHFIDILNVYLGYYMNLQIKINGSAAVAETDLVELNKTFLELRPALTAKKSKKVDIFTITSKLTRRLNGGRLTSCKSAKDRTSMSATLEFATLLQEKHSLPEIKDILRVMRIQGVRMENSFKNTQKRKYAFNALQVMSLPKEYRPPKGTGGVNVS